jgi:toxin YoeB
VLKITFVPHGWKQYIYWHSQDRKTLKRINILLEAAARDPFVGIGKPEALVGSLSSYWSRRIDEANRLIYRATDEALIIVSCRYHYDA